MHEEGIMKYIVAILCVLLNISSNSALLEKPNVLFIVIDDLRASLESYGGPIISPYITELASRSALFSNAKVQQSVCAPSRVSFLTGRRPDTTRLYDFGSYWRTHAGNYTTLPQHFKDNGYFTASVGKVFHPGIPSGGNDDYPYSWSIQPYHPSTALQGAKVCPNLDGTLHDNVMCPVNVSAMPLQSLPDMQSLEYSSSILKNLSAASHSTNAHGRPDKTSRSPRDPDMQPPFFLAVGFHKPHIPWKYPEEFKSLYPIESISIASNPSRSPTQPAVAYEDYSTLRQRDDINALNMSFPNGTIPLQFHAPMRQSYYAAATYTDFLVGKLLQTLNETGFSNNTIVILFGDHGWQLGEHAEWCKYSNYELATRVPLIVHVPGLTDKPKSSLPNVHQSALKMKDNVGTNADSGMVVTEFVELVDLFPTLSDLAGIEVPPTCPPDPFNVTLCSEGYSFAPLLEANSNAILVGNATKKLTSTRYSRWKNATYSQYPRPGVTPTRETDLPSLKVITVMGYSMRTKDHHYTEWIGFNHTTFTGNWTDVKARELYFNDKDYDQNHNVADDPKFKDIVQELSVQLKMGWRQSLPVPA
nr:iduronate 2-sulfatase-like [Lytechinus pictus]